MSNSHKPLLTQYLTPEEAALVEHFRALSPDDQAGAMTMLGSMAQVFRVKTPETAPGRMLH